jgi:hypothetical protein
MSTCVKICHHTCAWLHTALNTHVFMYSHSHTCRTIAKMTFCIHSIHSFIRIYIYIYIYIHTHTHTHTHTCACHVVRYTHNLHLMFGGRCFASLIINNYCFDLSIYSMRFVRIHTHACSHIHAHDLHSLFGGRCFASLIIYNNCFDLLC